MPSKFTKLHLMLFANCIHALFCKLYRAFYLQTVICIVISTCKLSSYKLLFVFLQTIILQTIICYLVKYHLANYYVFFSFLH